MMQAGKKAGYQRLCLLGVQQGDGPRGDGTLQALVLVGSEVVLDLHGGQEHGDVVFLAALHVGHAVGARVLGKW